MQDDHFSYKNCYQHGSCVKKKKTKKKLDLKSYIRNREIMQIIICKFILPTTANDVNINERCYVYL